MYPTSDYIAQQIVSEYTRDRVRDAEARRAARTARIAGAARRCAEPASDSPAPVRRRWVFSARTTTA